jgi:hypothetical protein
MPISKDDPRLERCGFAKLQGDAGDDFVYFIRKYEVVLGRRSKSANLDVPLGDSMNISRHHAAIRWNFTAQRWEITVKGKNGVHVNDELITPGPDPDNPIGTPLQSRDKLVIGDRVLWFLLPKRAPPPHQAAHRFPPGAKPQQQHMMLMQQQAMAAAQRLGRPPGMGAPPYGWQGPRPPAEAAATAAAAAAAAAAHLRGPLGPPRQPSRPMFPGGAAGRGGQQPRPPGPGQPPGGPRPQLPGSMHPMLGAYMAAAMAAGGGGDAAAAAAAKAAAAAEGAEGEDGAREAAEGGEPAGPAAGAAQAAALMAARQAGAAFPPPAVLAAANAGDPAALAHMHMWMQIAAQQMQQQGQARPAGGQRGGARR